MIDNCISLLMEEIKEKEYRRYVTDMLVNILQSQYTQPVNVPRYMDLIEPKPEPKQTADEIIDNIKQKLSKLGG